MAQTKAPQKKAGSAGKTDSNSPRHAAPQKKSHTARKVLLVIIFILIAAAAAVIVYANTYSGIFPNTYVEEQNVSGMTENEVVEFLSNIYNEENLSGASLTLSCSDTSVQLPVKNLNIKFDNVALTQKVISSGKEGNPIGVAVAFISRFFKECRVSPEAVYDRDAFLNAIDNTASKYESRPVGHTFVIGDDSVIIHGPVDGCMVDRSKVEKEFESQLAMMRFSIIVLEPETVKPEKLNFDEFYTWLTSDAQDAYYEKDNGVVKVHDSKPKCEVSREAVQKGLDDLKNSTDNTSTISVTVIQPEKTTEKLKEVLYKDELGKYSTNFGGSTAARANNGRLSASRVNGTELLPGEEFSYDKTIKPRTASNGYMAAPVYVGNKVESGMGGGICQTSSTLYSAVLYANLEILERHNHSLPVGYIPLGMDATIAEGVLDLRFRNNTDYPVKLVASANGGVVSFTVYGYNPDGTSVSIERSNKGDTYYVTRVVKKNGEVVKRENMRSSTYGKPEKEEKEKEKQN